MMPPRSDWVRLHLVGDGKATNRDAIGAEVAIEAGGTIRRWFVSPTHGYLSQSERTVTFGNVSAIDRVTVRWPASGKSQEWLGLKAGATYELIEDRAQAVVRMPR